MPNDALILGIDEAGRGCALGPLVIAGVLVSSKRTAELIKLGVKDSKRLTPQFRTKVYDEITSLAEGVEIIMVPPYAVNLFLRNVSSDRLSLNLLESIIFAKIIASLSPDVCFIDSPDPNPKRFHQVVEHLVKLAGGANCRIVCLNKADEKFPVVGAASIIAKVARDKEISRISDVYWQVGSGYPHDPLTLNFLSEWVRRFNEIPHFARSGWSCFTKIAVKEDKFSSGNRLITDFI